MNKIIFKELDEETEVGLDSEFEISDAEDLDFVLQDQAGVVGVSWNPALLNGVGSSDDIRDSSSTVCDQRSLLLNEEARISYKRI